MTRIDADVCVIGGGPAGSALAIRLAQLGHSTVVVERAAFPRHHVGESLVGAVLPVLDVLGVRAQIEHAGFLRPSRTILRWAQPAYWRDGSGEPGFQVDRSTFDAILLNGASALGVQVLQPAWATAAAWHDDTWQIAVYTAGSDATVRCRMLADAAGRAGWIRGPKRLTSAKTVALYAYWSGVPLKGPETRVEAGDRQWYWGAPLPADLFNAAVFLDPSEYREGSRAFDSRALFYEHLLARSELLSGCLQGRRASAVHASDATARRDEVPATPHSIKVGEAAFSIDPLSSQGVQTALGSALHAAAAVHTILERPTDGALAVEFYRQRQVEAAAYHARAAAEVYHEMADVDPSRFWTERSAGRQESPNAVPRPPAGPLTHNTIVQLADGVRLEAQPVLRGDFVVQGRSVAVPEADRSVAFLGDVELAPLLELARAPVTADSLVESWARSIAPRRALAILEWVWNQGLLCTNSS